MIGHSTANRRPRPIRQHLIERLRRPERWLAGRLLLQLVPAAALRTRCSGCAAGTRMDAAKRRAVRRISERRQRRRSGSPGCSAGGCGASGVTTRRSTASSSTATRWSGDGPSRSGRWAGAGPGACFPATRASRPRTPRSRRAWDDARLAGGRRSRSRCATSGSPSPIPRERQTTIKERALQPGTWLRGDATRLEALRGISFDVARGEFFGVIGRNGGGKSTLLKLLASIYQADSGEHPGRRAGWRRSSSSASASTPS